MRMTSLQDGSLVTTSEGDNSVKMWSRGGQVTKEVVGKREFFSPQMLCVWRGWTGSGLGLQSRTRKV